MGLGIKTALKIGIASGRGNPAIKAVHGVAEWFVSSFENEGSDFNVNGERELLHRLKAADFRLILDVGANVGEWAEQALLAWPNSHVHAFEIAPQTADALEQHVAQIGMQSRVDIHRIGASDEPGELTMYYYPENPQMTCDAPRHSDYRMIPFTGQLTTLDKFAAEHGLKAVDFLKIDVEGAEHRVLDGFTSFMAKTPPKAIQFEYGPFATDTRVLLKDFYGRLAEQYWIGKIFPNGVEFRDYTWELEDFRFANYFCVLKSEPTLRDLAKAK